MLAFFGVLIGLGLVGLFIILPIVAIVRARRAARLAQQSQDNWQRITQRVHALETQLQEVEGRSKKQTTALEMALQQLRELSTAHRGPMPAAPTPPEPPTPPAVAVGVEAPELPRPAATLVPSAPALTVPPAVGIAQTPASPSITPSPTVPSPTEPPAPAADQPGPPIPPPHIELLGAKKPSASETAKRVLNMEEVLGTDWLNKLGMFGIVIGAALLLAYEMQTWGPRGRVLLGFAVSAAFLGAGFFFERRERWRILARAAMGGGWALLYFTTYAMNHIGAARVLESESCDFVLLLIVAAVMVAHTLRYNSRVVTGLAFLLAFSTINISHAGPTSLIATAILAVALAVIVVKRRWFDLEVLAIAAIFVNHYFWLRPIIEPMGAHRHHFPEFIPSAALLIFYWLVFRVSYLLRREVSEEEEKVSTFAALLNSSLLLGVMKYQSVHPEWAFYALLALGAVEFTLGQLPITRRRRAAFVVLSVIGATFMVVAIPFRYSGERLPLLWLAEAEALFLAGVFTREILFRWLGIAVELLVAGHMFFVDTRHLFDLREAKATDFSDPRRAVVFAVAALVLFANAHWVPRRWPDLLKTELERKYYRLQSYLGGILMLAAIWAVCTEPWLAVGFAAAALLLAVVGARWRIEELSVLANSFALLGFLRVVFANFAVVEVSYFNASAVISISLAATLLYIASRWIGFPSLVRTYRIPEAYTWVATFVVALLAWYQLWPASVALGWALIGLVLFQLGFQRRSASLRLQSYLLLMASFFRIFFVNFNAEETAGLLSPRLYTALPLALLFYFVYGRLERNPEEFLAADSRFRAADVHCYLGTITVAAAMRFELNPDWIAAAWSGVVLLFVFIAWRYGRRIFLAQALLLGATVFFRTLLHNFYQRSYFPPPSAWSGGWMTVGTSILLLFLTLLVARRLKQPTPEATLAEEGRWKRALASLSRNPAQVFFFAAFILLAGMLYMELRTHGMATVGWAAEAVCVFLFALAVKERSYRLSALTLLLICVAKIVCVDVWGLKPLDRDLTILLLSVALFAVSVLYTRYKEVLRAYL
ncbi:MAG: DUF2339 domain-containing protein [Acidobacteriota bacterium]|nr:DUF2339 domain-containing protein [Acidobacteriota bacterium]